MATGGRPFARLGAVNVRLGTWNILSGSAVNSGMQVDLAAEVAKLNLDVLGLNEVDHRQERSGRAEQTRDAARAMGASDWRFGPSYSGVERNPVPVRGALFGPDDDVPSPHYGIALISRVPVRRWHRLELGRSPVGLPLLNSRDGKRSWYYCVDEPHLAIAAELENGWVVVATHLSFVTPVAIAQLLRVRLWANSLGRRVAIVGDMNLARAFIPLRPHWQSTVNRSTYPSWKPAVQLDHILLPRGLSARALELPQVSLSDHLPIAVEIA